MSTTLVGITTSPQHFDAVRFKLAMINSRRHLGERLLLYDRDPTGRETFGRLKADVTRPVYYSTTRDILDCPHQLEGVAGGMKKVSPVE